jgi:acyl-CoA synthetase (NDP forming)
VLFFTYYPLSDEILLGLMEELRDRIQKPLFVVPGYPTRQTRGMLRYNQQGIPSLPTTERAAKAIAALRRYAEWLQTHPDK